MRSVRPPAADVDPVDPVPPADHPRGLGEDSGPNPLVRAVAGLLVGLAAGALAASFIPRPERAARRTAPQAGRRP